MTPRTVRLLAWAPCTISIATLIVVLAYGLVERSSGLITSNAAGLAVTGATVLFVGAFATVGALVSSRRPQTPIGWLLSVAGLCYAIGTAGLLINKLPGGARWADWIGSWVWGLGGALAITFVLLLFPTGRLPSRRWRPVAWLTAGTIGAFVVGSALVPGPISGTTSVNPLGFGGAVGRTVFGILRGGGTIGFLLMAPVALASLVVRYRRADRPEREQLRWLIFAGIVIVAGIVLSPVITRIVHDPNQADDIENAITSVTIAFVPIAIGIAVLKYRLYDIDVVINKTVVFGALAAFITVVYVAIVLGAGRLVGSDRNALLSIVATAVVATAFQPVRERVQRFANRLVYGKRATPYEVMAGFSHRVAGTLSIEQVLPEMATAAARGIGGSASRVRLLLPEGERTVTWPPGDGTAEYPITVSVTFQGEPIGEIAVAKPPGEPLTPEEQRLFTDLASQAGLAFHNVRLTEELGMRLAELAEQAAALRVSRERLVTARDAQRRGLERDIREGPQRHLLDIARQLREATESFERNPADAEARLDRLGEQAGVILEGLRDLARGIFPPLLADKGIGPALEAHVRKVGANVRLEPAPGFLDRRFEADAEACVYFCCLQAIQNVMRHAGNAGCTVRLAADDGILTFEVADEGSGFEVGATEPGMGLQIMQDRVDALDGDLTVVSQPGRGTTVMGRVPVQAEVMAG